MSSKRAHIVLTARPLDRTTTIVEVVGSLGAEAAMALTDVVSAAITRERRDVVFNLTGVSRLDAAGLGQLAASVRAIRDAGGIARVIVPNDDIRELLERTRLLDAVQVLETSATAALPSPDR